MAIFTKDGKSYTVHGPNPLVNKQRSWEPSKLVFHNFAWDEITHCQVVKTPPKVDIPKPVAEDKKVEVEYSKEMDSAPDGRENPNPSLHEEKREFDLPYIKYKVLCHCLPARVEQRSDSLYGESWGRIKYGGKIIFPCVVISSSDLSFEFWTSDPDEKIGESSIVYPFSYEVHNTATNSHDKVPYNDYRWWKVSRKEPKKGGWLFTANPSDFQPDFSD